MCTCALRLRAEGPHWCAPALDALTARGGCGRACSWPAGVHRACTPLGVCMGAVPRWPALSPPCHGRPHTAGGSKPQAPRVDQGAAVAEVRACMGRQCGCPGCVPLALSIKTLLQQPRVSSAAPPMSTSSRSLDLPSSHPPAASPTSPCPWSRTSSLPWLRALRSGRQMVAVVAAWACVRAYAGMCVCVSVHKWGNKKCKWEERGCVMHVCATPPPHILPAAGSPASWRRRVPMACMRARPSQSQPPCPPHTLLLILLLLCSSQSWCLAHAHRTKTPARRPASTTHGSKAWPTSRSCATWRCAAASHSSCPCVCVCVCVCVCACVCVYMHVCVRMLMHV